MTPKAPFFLGLQTNFQAARGGFLHLNPLHAKDSAPYNGQFD
jgi:hypothetical protein